MKSHDKRSIYFQIKIGCYLHVIFQKSDVDKMVMLLEIKKVPFNLARPTIGDS